MKVRELKCKECGGPPVDIGPRFMELEIGPDSEHEFQTHAGAPASGEHDVVCGFHCAAKHLTPFTFAKGVT